MLVTLTAPSSVLFVNVSGNSIELKEEKNHKNDAKITLRVTGSRLFLPQFTFHNLVRITMQILSPFISRPLCPTFASDSTSKGGLSWEAEQNKTVMQLLDVGP
jgi:hypothetical protein